MKKRLEAVATTGKIKFIEIEAENEYLITRWGYVDGKVQETKEKCEAMNIGKKNFISAEKQAILRLERKIKKKMESGYTVPGAVHLVDKFPNLSALQKYFAPCKPIAKPPKDALSGGYLADRKYNGVNLIITKDKNGFGHIYTRRIDDITKNLEDLPEFEKVVKAIPSKSMLLIELIYVNNNRVEEPEHLRALINKRRSKEAVHERYHKINKNGKIVLMVFDVMFWNGKNMCDVPFLKRRGGLDSMMSFRVPVAVEFTQRLIDLQKGKWEGFVLRKPDGKITYTMNGKAKRFGSWKWKYEITDDFIVVGAEYGKGKRDRYFSRFKLAQYNKDGDLVDCGYCGPGNLKVAELEDLHKNRKATDGTYNIKPYMVIEVLFRARASGGVKLEFPVFKRIRDDKKPTECIYND
jgi:ATP-dependent DNA ligase